jgi:hypothetical protein
MVQPPGTGSHHNERKQLTETEMKDCKYIRRDGEYQPMSY